MKLLCLWLYFVVALMASCKVTAEYIDNLPPIPYQLSVLIEGATINLPITQFANAIESDSNKFTATVLKRGGQEGQELLDAFMKCDDKTIPMTDERKARCFDTVTDAVIGAKTILYRDHGRAVFKLAGYSFDKSLVAFANDCNTFGSCDMLMDKIFELTNNPESMAPAKLFIVLCAGCTPNTRKLFLPLKVAAACTKMMSSASFKKKIVCADKSLVRDQSICNDNNKIGRKTRYCTESGSILYPEIDCN